MGFGHRVYKNYDPRAKIIKHTAYQVFMVTGENRKIDMAREWADRAGGRILHLAQALPERRFLLRESSTRRWASGRTFHGAVLHPARGGLAGAVARRCWPTPNRRSPGRARSTRAIQERHFVPLGERGAVAAAATK